MEPGPKWPREQLESALMTRGIGTIFLGAALASLFSAAPKALRPRPLKARLRSRPVDHADSIPPARLFALVQTKPQTLVLAMSESRDELERELIELNETWNHWQLRHERQRYEIQSAPVLRRVGGASSGRHIDLSSARLA